jgi:hypothetical protein
MASANGTYGIETLDVANIKKNIVRYFPKKIYHVTFEQRDGVNPGIDMIIYNKDASPPNNHQSNPREFSCIECNLFYLESSKLHIESLKQCGLNGTNHLERLITFSEAYGFSEITLEDGSEIVYTSSDDATNTHSIGLKQLRRLMTGQSWYEKFGFTNAAIDEYKDRIKKYIRQPIKTFYVDEIISRIKEYASEVDPVIASDNTLEKIQDKSVSEAVSYLYDYLIKVCPKRVCPPGDVITIVDDIDDIITELYMVMLSHFNLEKLHFIHLRLSLPRKNQMGSSRKTRRNKKIHMASRRHRRTRRHT